MAAGSLAVDDVVLLPQGGLLLPADGTLVVADLHVGYEDAMRARGEGLPVGEPVAERVAAAFRAAEQALSGESVTPSSSERVRRIVVNGDVKHAFAPRVAQARAVRDLDARLAQLAPVTYVLGNHDAGLGALLPDADVVAEARAGRYRVLHGDRPAAGPRILGHEHPHAGIRDEVGTRVRLPAFLRVDDAWVLPALSPWAAGVDVLRHGFHGPALAAADPAEAEAYVLGDGEVLAFGPLGRLARRPARR